MSDHFIRAIAGGGAVLGFAAVTTETVEEARRRHQAQLIERFQDRSNTLVGMAQHLRL